ncbi:MAG: hypothetical protein AAF577_05770 [Pseudomonadota bacterium]
MRHALFLFVTLLLAVTAPDRAAAHGGNPVIAETALPMDHHLPSLAACFTHPAKGTVPWLFVRSAAAPLRDRLARLASPARPSRGTMRYEATLFDLDHLGSFVARDRETFQTCSALFGSKGRIAS